MRRGSFILLLTTGLLVLFAAVLLAAGTPAAADEPGKPRPLNWTPGRITGTVSLGETITRTVNLTVSQPITGPGSVVRPKRFQESITVSGLPGALEPGTRYPVTVTVTVPSNLRGRAFNLNVFLQSDGENRVIGPPLKVHLKLEHPARPPRAAKSGK